MPEVEIGTETHPRREKAQLDAPNGISQVMSAACSILQFDVLTFARSQRGDPVFSGMFYVPDVTVCLLSAASLYLRLSVCFLLTYAYDTLDTLTHLKLEGQLSVSILQTINNNTNTHV